MKTLDHNFGLNSGGAYHRHPLGGVVMELRFPLVASPRHRRTNSDSNLKLLWHWSGAVLTASYLLRVPSRHRSQLSLSANRIDDPWLRARGREGLLGDLCVRACVGMRCIGGRWSLKEVWFHF